MHTRLAGIIAASLLLALIVPASRRRSHASRSAAARPLDGTRSDLLQLSTPDGVAAALDRARAAGVDVVMPEAKNAWG